MHLVAIGYWPLGIAVLVMLIAAVLQFTRQNVPNVLTLTAILAGWVVGGLISADIGIPSAGGGLGASIAATVVALVISIPFYARLELGAGCVKAQMAFSAWIGCAVGFPSVMMLTVVCALVANIATYAIAWCCVVVPVSDEPAPFPAQVTHSLGALVGLAVCIALAVC